MGKKRTLSLISDNTQKSILSGSLNLNILDDNIGECIYDLGICKTCLNRTQEELTIK